MVEFGQTTLCRGSSEVLQLAELSTGKKRDLFRHPTLFLSRMLASRAIHIEVSNSLDTIPTNLFMPYDDLLHDEDRYSRSDVTTEEISSEPSQNLTKPLIK